MSDIAEQVEDCEEVSFNDIEELQAHGISMADITKLKSAGCSTVQSVVSMTRKNLCKIKGLSEIKVDKLKEVAGKIVPTQFETGVQAMDRRQKVLHISTGSTQFNQILGGGFQTGSISECYGEFRCGKTQLCHTLCVTAQLPYGMGGAQGKVAYIDTEGTFRPHRVKEIANRFDVDGDAALENILTGRALNSEHQMDLINLAATEFAKDGHYKLLIVDSIMALFRVDYSGRGELGERQQKLNQMLGRLTRIAEEFGVAVLLINQVQSDPGATMTFAPAARPIGGHVLAHASSTRVYLRKGRGDERIAKIVDSPECAEAEATYRITGGGIDDAA